MGDHANKLQKQNEKLQAQLADLTKLHSEMIKENGRLKKRVVDLSKYHNTQSPANKTTFSQAFQRNTKYISCKWSQYLPLYDKLFASMLMQKEPLNVLEIGVNNGGSLEIWQSILPAGSKIFGIDINEKCTQLQFSESVQFILGDASDPTLIQKHFADITFDIIIDDGSHFPHHVIKSFELLFPKLKLGGIYVVEDVHTSYLDYYGGGFRAEHSHVEYFKKIIDSLHVKYLPKEDRELMDDELQYLIMLNKEVASVSFYDSVIAIEKYTRMVKRPFTPHISRGQGLVDPDLEKPNRFDENSPIEDCYRK